MDITGPIFDQNEASSSFLLLFDIGENIHVGCVFRVHERSLQRTRSWSRPGPRALERWGALGKLANQFLLLTVYRGLNLKDNGSRNG